MYITLGSIFFIVMVIIFWRPILKVIGYPIGALILFGVWLAHMWKLGGKDEH